MNPTTKNSPQLRSYIIWGVVAFTVIYRLIASQVPALSNSSPTMALCFGGGLLLGKKYWWVPAALVLVSDYLIGAINGGGGIGGYTILTAILFCGAAWLGSRVSQWNGKSWPTMWCGVLLCSVIFYLAANTYSWAMFPGYEKSFAGWWQSQTTGLPGFAPSWMFLRNALLGDTVWCILAGVIFFFRGEFWEVSRRSATS